MKQFLWGMFFVSIVASAQGGSDTGAPTKSFSIDLQSRSLDDKGRELSVGNNPRVLSARDFEKAIAAAKKRAPVSEAVARDVASSDWSGQQSAEYRAFRDKFRAIKSTEELHRLLLELEQGYDNHPADLKLVAIAMSGLRIYRGIVYRFGPLFDDVKFAKAQSMTMIARAFRALNLQFPYEHVKVVQSYLQEPSLGIVDKTFKTEDDARVFLGQEVLSNHELAVERLSKISLEPAPIVDGELMLGLGRQAPATGRFAFGEAQRQNLLSALRSEMAGIAVLAAYSVAGKIEVHYDLMKALHSDSTRGAVYVAGLTTEDVVGIFFKPAYKNYLTLMKSGPNWMRRARAEARLSAQHSMLYWSEVKAYAGSQIPQYDPAGLIPQMAQLETHLQTLLDVLAGPTLLRDTVTGDMVKVDMNAYFDNPPKDRKVFFPTKFRQSENRTRLFKVGNDRKAPQVRLPDFSAGEPTGWNLELWKRYFPGVKTQADLDIAFRVVSQNWVNLPAFIFVTPLPLLL